MKTSTENEFNTLLQYNNQRYQQFADRPFFKMISSGILNKNDIIRHSFFNYMQIFADHFQLMILTRQSSCVDERFYPAFLEHLLEEMGHDDLLRKRQNIEKKWDPVLHAVATWFIHQMQVLDNVEKTAIMHLVLETSGDFYHRFAGKILGDYIKSDYYEVHEESDEHHVAMGVELLKEYPEWIYQRLQALVNQAWDMMDTMVDRVHFLIYQKIQRMQTVINQSEQLEVA